MNADDFRFFLIFIILYVLFGGDPDLVDSIGIYLRGASAPQQVMELTK